MSHMFFDGEVYHKRYMPKEHSFRYNIFMLGINTNSLSSLKNKLFSLNRFNLFSFHAKDHFGKSDDLVHNIEQMREHYGFEKPEETLFLTLPRVMNFVFNPISIALFLDEEHKAKEMIVEVHNYNGGRVLYPVILEDLGSGNYRGEVLKDMYVSPFFDRIGEYRFDLFYDKEKIRLGVTLFEEDQKKLTAFFHGKSKPFETKSVMQLFCKHTFMSVWVVTRTLWQSLLLYLKGMKFNAVTELDNYRRY